ncbi:MAG: ABC transporter substrate-binding protein [Dehalococcoidia bacterium]
MKMLGRKGFVPLIMLALTLGLVAACTGGGQEDPTPSNGPGTGATATPSENGGPTTEPGGEIQRGGTINRWITQPAENWDIGFGTNSSADWANDMMYESLLQFRVGPDTAFDQVVLEPGLAESWEVSDDATVFTFHLRQGVHWADLPPVNGREVTSEDVKFSFEYTTRTGEFADMDEYFANLNMASSLYAGLFSGLESIETPDPYTVVLTFPEPYAPFLTFAADGATRIFPREIYDEDGHFRDHAMGTGAFQMDWDASSNTEYTLRANEDYWQEDLPYLDAVRAVVIPDASTAFGAFAVGQLHMLAQSGYDIVPEEAQQIRAQNSDAVVLEISDATPQHMYVNTRRPPFDDVRVRRALSLGINRQELIDTFTGGKGAWAMAGVMPSHFTQEEVKEIVRYDPEEAQALLAEAGYPNGVDIEFFLSARYGQSYATRVELLQAQLAQAGFNMSLRTFDHAEYLENTRGNTFDITFRGKSVQSDVQSYLQQYVSTDGRNYSGVNDPVLDELIEQQRAIGDEAERNEVIRQIGLRINDEMVWDMALFRDITLFAHDDSVKGFNPHWVGDPYPYVWLDE